ncbi:Hypothetical protein R9X50_00015600 [Acrodontium crateriforme]|uniref:Aminotransferase class V domain-containing protein n=1 Tax=Acrodontium crateriforme TaxID=150365 RepID=A0AAQ3LXK7_9PEZI|nr:Hypothetical protein R9X50_00015600 [Acrodontium crateriforme]
MGFHTELAIRPAKRPDPMREIRRLKSIECGIEAAKHFALGEGYRNLNHGSFGTYPTAIRDVLRHYQEAAEERPDKFIRYEYPKLLDESRELVANLLNAPTDTIVLVPNATSAFNTVVRNLVFKPDDVIVYYGTIYGACEKTLDYLSEITPVEAHRISITYPVTDDDVCSALEDKIRSLRNDGKNVRLAIFDTIVALPGVRMPFERLTDLCHKLGVSSCIDAAHSIGQIEVNLETLNPDYYFSNCHKWLHVPRGCCVLYVPKRNQSLMRSTLPTSHYFIAVSQEGKLALINPLPPSANSDFVLNFEFVGTIDSSPYLCIPSAIEWRSKLVWNGLQGEQAILGYIHGLAREGGAKVAQMLGTEVLDNTDKTLQNCAFSNVALPLSWNDVVGGDSKKAVKVAQWIARVLAEEYDTFIAIIFFGERFWMRISAQVYLTIEDFEWGGKVLAEVCERVKKREWDD